MAEHKHARRTLGDRRRGIVATVEGRRVVQRLPRPAAAQDLLPTAPIATHEQDVAFKHQPKSRAGLLFAQQHLRGRKPSHAAFGCDLPTLRLPKPSKIRASGECFEGWRG